MFHAIISGNSDRLQQLGLIFHKNQNKAAALLCLDHIFDTPPHIQGATIQHTISSLAMFYTYVRLLHNIANLVEPCHDPLVQKLFAFQVSREDMFEIFRSASLHREVDDKQERLFHEKDGKRSVSRGDLSHILKFYLGERLQSRIMEENDICRRAKVFSPCLNALLGTCARVDCPRDHVDPAILNPDWYNLRVRIHLQQILIFQNLHFVNLRTERQRMYVAQRVYCAETNDKNGRYWLDRLYEALNPYFYPYGCRANLDLTLIPEAEKGLVVVQDWVRHTFYTNDPNKYWPAFLTTFMRSAILSFDYNRKDAFGYIHNSPCMYRRPPPSLVRKDYNVYVVKDLVTCLHGDQPWCLSAGVIFVR
jgi:hypothetical protein